MVIEIEDVDSFYAKAIDRQLPIMESLGDQAWGHRSFTLIDPNDVAIYFLSEVK